MIQCPRFGVTLIRSMFFLSFLRFVLPSGKDSFEHIGNKHFRELIGDHINSYLEAGTRQEKSAIVAKIYDHIRRNASEPSSGFVRKVGLATLVHLLKRQRMGKTT